MQFKLCYLGALEIPYQTFILKQRGYVDIHFSKETSNLIICSVTSYLMSFDMRLIVLCTTADLETPNGLQ